jgi:hypothetical protein
MLLNTLDDRPGSRSLTPMTQCTLWVLHASTSRSTSGPGTSTDDCQSRMKISSNAAGSLTAAPAHAQVGYRATKHSGNTISSAPSSAASPIRATAFSTDAAASSTTGVAWTAATRTVRSTVMKTR